jgi:hypothetical protein
MRSGQGNKPLPACRVATAAVVAVILTTSVAQAEPTRVAASADEDPVIAAAGDIACDPAAPRFNGGDGTATRCHMKGTGQILQDLLATTNLQRILPIGDTQYECGGLQAYDQSYGPTWGQASLKAISSPVPGDQEYGSTGTDCPTTPGAGYYTYFGSAAGDPSKGYYSYDIGSWHIVALNSECARIGCTARSAQYQFLTADLAAHPTTCTLAYWHRPRFTSSGRGGTSRVKKFWDALYAAGAEIVLGGNQHYYERFATQTPSQQASEDGIREFVLGTGGKSHGKFGTTQPNSEVRNNDAYGVLELTLHSTSYDWQFVPEAGASFTDSGTTACHTAPPTRATCGVWRWPVKTLSDPARRKVVLDPRVTTVKRLRNLDRPSSQFTATTPRRGFVEFHTFRIRARPIQVKLQDDEDIRLVVSIPDMPRKKMIVEFPKPICVESAFKRNKIGDARSKLLQNCGRVSESSWSRLAGSITLVGVGFWGERHGQTGIAPNGIELHPVLNIVGDCHRRR